MPAMAEKRIRRRVVVHGRVQGVFFRGSTQDEARRVGVDGWVRNRPDGAVEAVFEGEAAGVEQLVAYCRRGPSWARVTRVEVIEEAPEGERGFRVRY
jgi:acylphosphatase